MVVSRIRPIVLCKKTLQYGTLDDTETWTEKQVIAHITEVNGAQVQNNLFGKQYAMTWVARVRGNQQADAVKLPTYNDSEPSARLDVIQIRKHATRTDIYFGKDREASANELEQ